MKLIKELKNKINQYFDSVTSEELYKISVEKYNFKDRGFSENWCSTCGTDLEKTAERCPVCGYIR